MLTRLIIRNYAIIPELELSIQPGLSIITGETGAGKSILLGALGLALGKRADAKVLPDEKSKCIVEAHFKLADTSLKELFSQEGLDFDELLICRREISPGGRSRSFINDTPVSLKTLQEITSQLIELHHQHDNLALQSKEYQVNVLDTISGSLGLFNEYRTRYIQWIHDLVELEKIKQTELSSARRKDFLLFQITELENAHIKKGETAELEETQNLLQHAEAIEHTLQQLQTVLSDGHQSISNQLTVLIKQIDTVRSFSTPLASIGTRLDALRLEVQDLAMESGKLEGSSHKEPNQLARIESRLSQIYVLIKKYLVSDEDGLLELLVSIRKEYDELTSIGDQIIALEEKIENEFAVLKSKALELSKLRNSGAKTIIPKMNSLLSELGMPNGKFSVELIEKEKPGADGIDDISFLFSANKGMSMQPIQAVASGGELSRLSLALKSLYAAQAKLPTIIFDEIDTGISGEVAWRMGQLIRTLAKGHQILMITHSPQIAAHAITQYHVSKVLSGGKDISSVQLLNSNMRLTEIAKMLSGDPPSKEAIANAKSLVESIRN